ncbi:MAG: hypothetical protein V3S52_06105, partial [Gemmatimonadota bacterium]
AMWVACADSPQSPAGLQGPGLDAAVTGLDRAILAQELGPAIRAQERHTDELLGLAGVVGTAVGLNGGGRPAVKVYTTREGVRGIPRSLDGIPVVVEVTGPIVALQQQQPRKKPNRCPPTCGDGGGGEEDPAPTDPTDPTSRFPRPVPIGVSTGHPDITAGTIGARVFDMVNQQRRYFALSNNHVYAKANTASMGDFVIQPGTHDGGSLANDIIGTLHAFQPIVFSSSANNVIDAAIALSSTANLDNRTPSDGYGAPESTTASATVGLRVRKYGRTTGQTNGRIDAVNAIVNVNYGATNGVARFVDQIIIKPGNFSAGGDSGSLIVVQKGTDALKPVGLLFAGGFGITVANPIDEVLSQLGMLIGSTLTIDGN